eukprot:g5791.t1
MMSIPRPNNGWFFPQLYIRPNYFFIITPFGTQQVPFKPIIVIPTFVVCLLLLLWFLVRKCLFSKRYVEAKKKKKILYIATLGEDKGRGFLDYFMGIVALSGLVKDDQVDCVGIVTGKPSNKKMIDRWIRAFHLFEDVVVPVYSEENDFILKSVEQHGNELCVVVAGQMTPLKNAILMCIEGRGANPFLKLDSIVWPELCVELKTKPGLKKKCPCCRTKAPPRKIIIPSISRCGKFVKNDARGTDFLCSRLQKSVSFVSCEPMKPSARFKKEHLKVVASRMWLALKPGDREEVLGEMFALPKSDVGERSIHSKTESLEGEGMHFSLVGMFFFPDNKRQKVQKLFPVRKWGRHKIIGPAVVDGTISESTAEVLLDSVLRGF